ncbi:MAG: MMPL family transporter [Candidatus Omnitrophota bacterium]|nr:MMPL family transporter [Candidatus Omnitrophota bacterium]
MGFKNILAKLSLAIIPLALVAVTVFSGKLLFEIVDLQPKVESQFFFSEDDPAYREDHKIAQIFPEPEQIALAVRGRVGSPEYEEKIRNLTIDLLGMPSFFAAQSLTLGPKSPAQAASSPLWKRVVFSKDGQSTLILLFTYEELGPEIFTQIEQIAEHYEDKNFRAIISGSPYVIDLIRRYLVRDFQVFSVAALAIFTLVMLSIFHSLRILVGTIVACTNASIATLFAAHWLHISIGPLTANLTTIVFVLTLSHIAYMTFNWKHIVEDPQTYRGDPAWEAVKMTFRPSFWSMFTTFLGFVTLIFVEAAPFRRLGITGSVGTLIAFASAYLFYPWFLRWKARPTQLLKTAKPILAPLTHFFSRRHPVLMALVFFVVIGTGLGLRSINNDPHLLSYFKEGSALREGLDYIDRNWGSSVLKIVIHDEKGRRFNQQETYENLTQLHERLEQYPAIGSVVSVPLIMAEARARVPLPRFMVSWERILKHLERPEYGGISQQFVSGDRKRSLLLLRMKALYREEPRMAAIERIKTTIWAKGFVPEIVGGLYLLQGELGSLVLSSLFIGLGILLALFFLIGLALSQSIFVTGALFVSLVAIPVGLLGLIGHLKIPLDMISAPATNLAIAMGVDAMIHMVVMARRLHKEHEKSLSLAWSETSARLWKPVLTSMSIVCAGFAIFMLSYFPPTQRFGIAVVSGSIMSAIAALVVLPTLAGSTGADEDGEGEGSASDEPKPRRSRFAFWRN